MLDIGNFADKIR